MTRPWLRILRVGGSLFDCAALPTLMTSWMEEWTRTTADSQTRSASRGEFNVFIAGGGSRVDHVRQLDQRFSLGPESSHWMSISAMRSTAEWLARQLNIAPVCRRLQDLQVVKTGQVKTSQMTTSWVFEVQHFLREEEPLLPGVRLTRDWRTTSDSIAARVARVLQADELILLKSGNLPPRTDWTSAARQGLVDSHFPKVAADLPEQVIKWVNLRRSANWQLE